MDGRNEIGDFLTSRRARITPERAGLPSYGAGHRRVPGLRREEVALLAGMSVDYYTRLERGHAGGVSDGVLEALARALQLDEAEREHLFDLVRAVNATTATQARRRPAKQPSSPRCSPIRAAQPTSPGSFFSTPPPPISTWTGNGSPPTRWHFCVPRPDAIRTTGI